MRTHHKLTLYVYCIFFLTFSRVFLASLLPSLCHAFSLTYRLCATRSLSRTHLSFCTLLLPASLATPTFHDTGVLWAPIVAWWHLFQRMTMVHCKQKMHTKFLGGKFLASDNLEDQKVDVRIILNHVLRKYVLRMWISTQFPSVWSSGKIFFAKIFRELMIRFNRWKSHK